MKGILLDGVTAGAFLLGFAALKWADSSPRVAEATPAPAFVLPPPAAAEPGHDKDNPAPERKPRTQDDGPDRVARADAPEPPAPTERDTNDPVHREALRFLGDMTDLLDTIRDAASLEEAKPQLLARAQEHMLWATGLPDEGQGLGKLSPAAGEEVRRATERHAKAVDRAAQAVPGVRDFYRREIAPLLRAAKKVS
jgi:hypothetical protein